MRIARPTFPRALAALFMLFAAVSCIGITWGLPSRKIDKYLFGGGEVWSGEKIFRLAKAGEKLSPDRAGRTGADVDVDPSRQVGGIDTPVPLTSTDEDIAKIYLRYRLYTYQPDEMITMMALAGMRPGRLQLDPRLYQYGGLFIYPVGALIKLCGTLGLIDLRSDVVYYLDRPDEFGKFYIVARAYSAAWGLFGVFLVYLIARRLACASIQTPSASDGSSEGRDSNVEDRNLNAIRAGLLAALLFVLLPVVVCMSHEGKPHLPGAVLMLAAVHFALRSVDDRPSKPSAAPRANPRSSIDDRQSFWWLCLSCGASVGMVLSSWPICVLIPLVALLRREPGTARRTVLGLLASLAVYFAANPYVPINAFINRDVLRSNFGNSLAMYQVARIGEGFVRVLELTIEGATLPVLVLGLVALMAVLVRKNHRADPAVWVLIIPAAVFFLQFVAIGAGKPAEYGRFGIFPNAALVVGAACLLNARFLCDHRSLRWMLPALVLAWVAAFGVGYLRNFHSDTTDRASRIVLADRIAAGSAKTTAAGLRPVVIVSAEPAPYCCPPLDFADHELVWVRSAEQAQRARAPRSWIALRAVDSGLPRLSDAQTLLLRQCGIWEALDRPTPISWANKPFVVDSAAGAER